MKRKAPQKRLECPQVNPSPGSPSKASSKAPLKRSKHSLESLLAETPEYSQDEVWEKMAPGENEF
jgi:hypothetical protein